MSYSLFKASLCFIDIVAKLINKLFLDATDAASREPEYKICAARLKKKAA